MKTAGLPVDSAETYAALVPVAVMGPGRLELLDLGALLAFWAWGGGVVAWGPGGGDAGPGDWSSAVDPATTTISATAADR
jgi:hypothetical protein